MARAESLRTTSSDVAGTPLYLAPEILAGGDATVQSDIYSLGVLLYYLVTGSYPVRAETLSDLRLAHQCNERTSIRTARGRSDLSPKLARIIERAIDPRPDRRYASADALAADLATLQPRPTLARLPYAIAAAAVLLLIAGLGWESRWQACRILANPRRTARWRCWMERRRRRGCHSVTADHCRASVQEPERRTRERRLRGRADRRNHPQPRRHSRAAREVARFVVHLQEQAARPARRRPATWRQPRRRWVRIAIGQQVAHQREFVRVEGDVLLWSEPFDRELKDIFDIQDDISRTIVNKLRLTLGRGQRRYETDVEAYELYLKGSALAGRLGPSNVKAAAEMFEQVTVKDPTYAPAHARLAIAHALMAVPSGSIPFVEAHPIIRPAAVKALELDPLLADAHEAMGWVYRVNSTGRALKRLSGGPSI